MRFEKADQMSLAPSFSSTSPKKAATRQEIPIESLSEAEAANSVITHGVTVAKVSHDPTQASDEAGE